MVVFEPPVFDEELGFVEGVEGFHVEEFSSEVAVERFGVGILPWRAAPSPAGFGGQSQSLIAPQPLDALAVAHPALAAQDHVDPPIPIARMLPGQQPQPLAQPLLVGLLLSPVPLRRTVLAGGGTGSPLGHPETILQRLGGSASPLRAQRFPRATSRSMSISNAWSPTIRFSRAFSFSSCLSRTTSSGRIALYCARHRW